MVKRNRRQGHDPKNAAAEHRAFRWGLWASLGAAAGIVGVFSALMLWDQWERREASVMDRIAALERASARKSRPIIQIERASVYSMEGELVLETHPRMKTRHRKHQIDF